MVKHLLMASLLVSANLSYAAINGLSHHSRNNCVNNESISWDATIQHEMTVTSSHHPKYPAKYHNLNHTGPAEITRRAAKVCWGEALLPDTVWVLVNGYHTWVETAVTVRVCDVQTPVSDCSIYNGWWEMEDE